MASKSKFVINLSTSSKRMLLFHLCFSLSILRVQAAAEYNAGQPDNYRQYATRYCQYREAAKAEKSFWYHVGDGFEHFFMRLSSVLLIFSLLVIFTHKELRKHPDIIFAYIMLI